MIVCSPQHLVRLNLLILLNFLYLNRKYLDKYMAETKTPTQSKEVKKSNVKTVTGLTENAEAALCYALGWLSGLALLLLNKDSKKIKFHAVQSIILFGGSHILSIILGVTLIGLPIMLLLNIAIFVLWLVLIVKTYQGNEVSLPFIGDIAKKQVENS